MRNPRETRGGCSVLRHLHRERMGGVDQEGVLLLLKFVDKARHAAESSDTSRDGWREVLLGCPAGKRHDDEPAPGRQFMGQFRGLARTTEDKDGSQLVRCQSVFRNR
jgi:hypothetical protein